MSRGRVRVDVIAYGFSWLILAIGFLGCGRIGYDNPLHSVHDGSDAIGAADAAYESGRDGNTDALEMSVSDAMDVTLNDGRDGNADALETAFSDGMDSGVMDTAAVDVPDSCSGDSCGSCAASQHRCAGVCVSNGDVATCGANCTACVVPMNGTATCDGTNCGIACNAGFAMLGANCTLAPPRQIAPLSASVVSTLTPTLHWLLAAGTDGAHVQVCSDAACTSVLQQFDATGGATSAAIPTALARTPPITHYWRVAGAHRGHRRDGVQPRVGIRDSLWLCGRRHVVGGPSRHRRRHVRRHRSWSADGRHRDGVPRDFNRSHASRLDDTYTRAGQWVRDVGSECG